jgi:hypothetical protein
LVDNQHLARVRRFVDLSTTSAVMAKRPPWNRLSYRLYRRMMPGAPENESRGSAMRGEAVAGEMPRLNAFDEEFGRESVAILRGHRRRRLRLRLRLVIGLLLAAAIATVLALAWSIADEWQRPQAPLFPRSAVGPDEQVARLVREVATLKREIRELTEAQQQVTETIAALEAEQDNRQRASFWYLEPAALTFGIGGQSEPRATAAPARRSAARPKPRRREEPLSIEPPQ